MRKMFTLLMLSVLTSLVYAQTDVPDQNPNYRASRDRYMKLKDSLLASSNTTIQETYKAYDWYEAREERRKLRRDRRYNLRLARLENSYRYDYYNPYYGGRGWYNNYFMRPSIGYRSGNWLFLH